MNPDTVGAIVGLLYISALLTVGALAGAGHPAAAATVAVLVAVAVLCDATFNGLVAVVFVRDLCGVLGIMVAGYAFGSGHWVLAPLVVLAVLGGVWFEARRRIGVMGVRS